MIKAPQGKSPPSKHYGIGDIMVLVFHVISKSHEIKGSCDFIGNSKP